MCLLPPRHARLAFALLLIAPALAGGPPPRPAGGKIERLLPDLDAVLATDAALEVIADGFRWTEGPAWWPQEHALLFSDVPANAAFRWTAEAGTARYLAPSGYTGPFDGEPHQGSNGLKRGPDGRLLLCQHGDRRVARLEALNTFTTLADRFEGRRFNSPNDLAVTRGGVIFFTDPPYGLANLSAKPELGYSGVFRISPAGVVSLVTRELDFPNGIALSPDERTLYVASSDVKRPVVLAIALSATGEIAGPARVLFDATAVCRRLGTERPMDGVAVDASGNLWAAGPGGILVLSPDGRHLGTILTGRDTANCAFGDDDGRTLFITAGSEVLRIRTQVRGKLFP